MAADSNVDCISEGECIVVTGVGRCMLDASSIPIAACRERGKPANHVSFSFPSKLPRFAQPVTFFRMAGGLIFLILGYGGLDYTRRSALVERPSPTLAKTRRMVQIEVCLHVCMPMNPKLIFDLSYCSQVVPWLSPGALVGAFNLRKVFPFLIRSWDGLFWVWIRFLNLDMRILLT